MATGRGHYTYTFHVPDTEEYAALNRVLQSSPYPGGIRDRSRFVREVLMDALGLRQRPWLQRGGPPAPTQPEADPETGVEVRQGGPGGLPPETENVLVRGLHRLRTWGEESDV